MKVDNALTICGHVIESKSYNILKKTKKENILSIKLLKMTKFRTSTF